MGLDMYLTAERYFWSNDKDKEKLDEIRKLFPEIGGSRIRTISIEAGYWRKSNQIHKWFVENVQDGNDDCGRYGVSREHLLELKKICDKIIKEVELTEGMLEDGYTFEDGKKKSFMKAGMIIKNPELAERILPTTSGFFFGNTDYNEWYLDDLKNTVKIIEECLKLPDDWCFYYQSSW
jgi:hypothetical protein